jgi:DnaJ-class molecular chaperone
MFGNNGGSRDTKLYDVLGVSSDADGETIKKSYRKKALLHHPDRNKDNKEESETKFKEISHAYEILSDKAKRSTYDNFGLDAVNNSGGGGGGNPFDMFSNIFSQSNGFENVFNMGGNTSSRRTRSKNVSKTLDLNLDDIYCKKSLNITFDKIIICKKCTGSGAKDSSSIKVCTKCDGSGRIINIRAIGPGMISQTQSMCNLCNGVGKSINSKCVGCNGGKYETVKRKVNIKLDHGNKNGDKLIIPNEANENVDCHECGDLVLILNIKTNDIFKRTGNNLIIKKQINLVEALCGCNISFSHLDNRKILVKTGDIITPKTMKKIIGEGLNGGDLIIEFDILFPNKLTKERREYISKVLPGVTEDITNYDNYEIKILENIEDTFDKTNYKLYEDSPNLEEEYDETPVNCAQQ